MSRGSLILNTFLVSGISGWTAAWAHRVQLFRYSIPLAIISIVCGVWCLYETHKWSKEGSGPSNPPLD
jgi:hypothetical protein